MLHAGNALFPNLEFDVACWEYIASLGGIFKCLAGVHCFPRWYFQVACWEFFVSHLGIRSHMLEYIVFQGGIFK